MESVFEFLFKYRPLLFQRGDLAVRVPAPWLVALGLAAVIVGLTVWAYARARARARTRDRVVLSSLRLAALALLAFSLLRPVLVIPTVVPQRNVLGVLVDDSRSMRIADVDGTSRGAYAQSTFVSSQSDLRDALADRFMLRFFRFSDGFERISTGLEFDGSRTDLGRALDRARQELSSAPLAGLVMVTDGADNSEGTLTEPLLAMKAAGVPVYTVGVGRERFDRDIEISRVEAPRTILKGSSVVVDVMITQHGFEGRTVSLNVEDAGRIVGTREIELPPDGQAATVPVNLIADEAGPRVFRFHIPAARDEQVTRNNAREALVVVEDRREKILYFEGEPRFEIKFLRRALTGDENLQAVVLLRTAENKYLRLDVDDAEELAAGFPRTREELFAYRGLILGSVEASFFTHDQLQMIGEFVSQRGGGLLMLGSRRSFAEGGYAGTPLADALPVVLEASSADEPFYAEVEVELTPFGRTHPVTQIAGDLESSTARWSELPRLSTTNRISGTKPGASTLLTGTGPDDRTVVLAHQRYGRGKALALAVQDTWLWQMHADVPVDDMTHETFWRQLLRWLVDGVPEPVSVTAGGDRVTPGRPVTLTAEVHDSTYIAVNNATVLARVAGPTGPEREVPLEWRVERDGLYEGVFTPEAEGEYEIRVEARKQGAPLGGQVTYVRATDLDTEYFGAGMRAPLLRRLADETGGRFYTPGTVRSLTEDVSITESGTTVFEERDLWNMPVIFLMLLTLVGIEWGYRRARGLA